jgi:hypothetical protein
MCVHVCACVFMFVILMCACVCACVCMRVHVRDFDVCMCVHVCVLPHVAGMVGDPGVGKTSLMVRYVEGRFDEDYVETLGVNFLEKTIKLPTAQVIMSLWDLGGTHVHSPRALPACAPGPKRSRAWPKRSRVWPKRSRVWPKRSRAWPKRSRAWPKRSRAWPHAHVHALCTRATGDTLVSPPCGVWFCCCWLWDFESEGGER